MKISTKGRYAVRLMIDIAQRPEGESVSLKDISKRQDISLKYLEQIVNTLSKAGFLQSRRGSQGGYRLSKKPEEYTAGDILRATEGSLAPVACLENGAQACPREGFCPTLKLWKGLDEAVNGYLDSITIADLVKDAEENGGEFFYCI